MESVRARIVALTGRISTFGILLMVFLLPLLFLPFTMEFYEFNKSFLFLGIMLVVFLSWLINLAFTGTVSFWKTSFDNWILMLLFAGFIAFMFSQDRITSLIGFSGRLSEGVVVFVFLIAMTFIVRHVIMKSRTIDSILWCLLASAALLGLITLLQYVGVYLFSGFERLDVTGVRSFTPIGSTAVLPFYFLVILPVAVGFLINKGGMSVPSGVAAALTALIAAGFAISAGPFWLWPGIALWILMAVSVGAVVFFSGSVAKKSTGWLVVVGVSLALCFFVRSVPSIGDALISTENQYVSSPALPYDSAWRISSSALSQSLRTGLFGSGPDTFAYDFSRFRPASYNGTDLWNIRFTRSSSQLLETMGNMGVVGLAAWLGLFASVIIWITKTLKENHESPYVLTILSLGMSLLVLMVSSVITYFTLNLWFLFWLFLGVIVAVRAISNPRISEKVKLSLSLSKEKIAVEEHDILPYVMLAPTVLLFVFGAWQLQKIYKGEVYYQNARYNLSSAQEDDKRTEVLTAALQDVGAAIANVGYRDNYYADYATLSVDLLAEYGRQASENENKEQYQSIIDTLLALSTKSAEQATELNPINVRNWESRAYVYQILVRLTQGGYGDALLSAINQALVYDPIKPQLYTQRGVVYSLAGEDDEALEQLKTAVRLQPLLLSSRYELAMQYQKMELFDEAKAQLEIIKDVLKQNNLEDTTAYDQILEAIANVGAAVETEVEIGEEEIAFPDEEISPGDTEVPTEEDNV